MYMYFQTLQTFLYKYEMHTSVLFILPFGHYILQITFKLQYLNNTTISNNINDNDKGYDV